MPTATYIALANYTVAGSTDSEIVFSNIPTTGYRDLVLVMDYSPTSTESAMIRLNNNSSSVYCRFLMYGTGSTATGATNNSASSMRPGTGVSGNRMNLIAHFLDANVTNRHKNVLTRFNDAGNETAIGFFRFPSNSAITTITILQDGSGSFNIGSSFALYGIAS